MSLNKKRTKVTALFLALTMAFTNFTTLPQLVFAEETSSQEHISEEYQLPAHPESDSSDNETEHSSESEHETNTETESSSSESEVSTETELETEYETSTDYEPEEISSEYDCESDCNCEESQEFLTLVPFTQLDAPVASLSAGWGTNNAQASRTLQWPNVYGAISYNVYVLCSDSNVVRTLLDVDTEFNPSTEVHTFRLAYNIHNSGVLPAGEWSLQVRAVAYYLEYNSLSNIVGPYSPRLPVPLVTPKINDAIVIDARNLSTLGEFPAGHVLNAILIPTNSGSPNFITRVPIEIATMPQYNGKDTLIFIYCQGGNRSVGPSSLALANLGFTNVHDIGGWSANVGILRDNLDTRVPIPQPTKSITDDTLTWTAHANSEYYYIFAFENDANHISFDPSNNLYFFKSLATAYRRIDANDTMEFNPQTDFINPLPTGDYVFRVAALPASGSSTVSHSALSTLTATYISIENDSESSSDSDSDSDSDSTSDSDSESTSDSDSDSDNGTDTNVNNDNDNGSDSSYVSAIPATETRPTVLPFTRSNITDPVQINFNLNGGQFHHGQQNPSPRVILQRGTNFSTMFEASIQSRVPNPTREGYNFRGWIVAETGRRLTPYTVITENTTVTAQFSPRR